jgi:preprotein translocase subunit Sec61beta
MRNEEELKDFDFDPQIIVTIAIYIVDVLLILMIIITIFEIIRGY